MVCEKNNDVQHDFHNDPLKLVKKGDWLKVHSILHFASYNPVRGLQLPTFLVAANRI